MPRVSIKKKDYKKTDLTKYIVGEMRVQGVTQRDLAERLGLTQPAIIYKFNNNSFSYGDLLEIFDLLNTTDEQKVKLLTL